MTAKRLKDARWNIDTVDIGFGDLNTPQIRIEAVNYNAPSMIAQIDVRFRENAGAANFEHSRVYEYAVGGDESISAENVKTFIAAIFPSAVEV